MWRQAVFGLFAVAMAMSLLGCDRTRGKTEAAAPSTGSGTGAGEGVGILSPGAGGLSPVTGSQELVEGGGGVQQVVKERAKSVASQPPTSLGSSLGQDDD